MKHKPFYLTAVATALMALCSAASAAETYQFVRRVPSLTVQPPAATGTSSSAANTPTPAPSAPAPALTKHVELSSTSVDFGNVDVGSNATLRVLLSNIGTGSVSLGSATYSGASYSVDSNCPLSLASGAYCSANITFAPTTKGVSTGTLSIQTNADEGTVSVSMTGTGLQAIGALTPDTTADFGNVLTGSSASRTFVLTNTGNKALSGVYPVLTGTGLSMVLNNCGTSAAPATLAAGASCSMTVQYAPTQRSTLTGASLEIASQSQTLTGAGVAPTGALTPSANANFGTVSIGSPVSKTFTYTNNGDGDATSVRATLTGSNLTMTANTCGTSSTPVTIAKNGTCSITVQYAPTAVGSLSGASLAVSGAHADAAASLTLTGSAQEAPPASSNYVLLLHAEGTNGSTSTTSVVDSSPTPIGVASMGPTGVATIDTTTSKFGTGSLKLNNSWGAPSWGSAYVAYPVQTGGVRRFSMGTGDFTIDTFVKSSSFGCYGTEYFQYSAWDSTNNVTYPSWVVGVSKTGQLKFTVYNDNGTTAFNVTSTATFPVNTWTHIGVSRKSGTVRLFINGVESGSGTYSGGMELTRFYSDIPFILGKPTTGGNGCSSGVHNFDEVRVLKGYGVSTLPVPTAPYAP